MFQVRDTDTSEACYALLTPEHRRRIIRLANNVSLNPWVDNISKFTLYELGSMVTISYDHQGSWIVYHIDGDEIILWSVGVDGPYVSFDESE